MNNSTLEFAAKYHKQPSQEQRYGNAPYKKHLEDVVRNAEKYIHYIDNSNRVNVLSAAAMHDIIEDTEWTPRRLSHKFNIVIAEIVTLVSNVRHLDKKSEFMLTLTNIRKNDLAIYVKLCDRMANGINSKSGADEKSEKMYKKYISEYPIFRWALKEGNMYEEMWEELDNIFEYER